MPETVKTLPFPRKPALIISRRISGMRKHSANRRLCERPRNGRCVAVLLGFCAVGPSPAQESAQPPQAEAIEASVPATRLEARIEFERLIDEGRFGEALVPGTEYLELTLAQFGAKSTEAGQAWFTLAEAQRQAELFDEAELSYLNSIETYRSVEGPFSELTIDPSIGLGDAYRDDGQYMNAVSAWNEARTLQRRTFGLLSDEQIAVMDRMTGAFQAMSMYAEADEQQRAALTLVERVHGLGSVEALAAMYKYARWLRSVYRFFEERDQYERAIRIIRAEHGKDSTLLVEPWREIGNSFRAQTLEDPRGASALNSALELLENQADPDPEQLAATLTDIGDWKTAFGPTGSGHEEYLRAWQVLGSAPNGAARRTEWFQSTRPRIVYLENMSVRGLAQNPNDPDAVGGHVLVRFDVDMYGRTQNVEVLESDPPGFKDESAARSMRQSRFRPRIEDGRFVTARGLGYMITFRFMPDDED